MQFEQNLENTHKYDDIVNQIPVSTGKDHVETNLLHIYLVLYAFVGEWWVIGEYEYVRACLTVDVTVEN